MTWLLLKVDPGHLQCTTLHTVHSTPLLTGTKWYRERVLSHYGGHLPSTRGIRPSYHPSIGSTCSHTIGNTYKAWRLSSVSYPSFLERSVSTFEIKDFIKKNNFFVNPSLCHIEITTTCPYWFPSCVPQPCAIISCYVSPVSWSPHPCRVLYSR